MQEQPGIRSVTGSGVLSEMPCTLSVLQLDRVISTKRNSGILRIFSLVSAQYNARCYLDHFLSWKEICALASPFQLGSNFVFFFFLPFFIFFFLFSFFPFSLPLSFCSFFLCFLPLNPFLPRISRHPWRSVPPDISVER